MSCSYPFVTEREPITIFLRRLLNSPAGPVASGGGGKIVGIRSEALFTPSHPSPTKVNGSWQRSPEVPVSMDAGK